MVIFTLINTFFYSTKERAEDRAMNSLDIYRASAMRQDRKYLLSLH